MLSDREKSMAYKLKVRQGLTLDMKMGLTLRRIEEWYNHHGGRVHVAFSGGKDSTVLLHLVRSKFPEVPAVFVSTGLEYPEILDFVKTIENVTWVKPKMPFNKVVEKHGYPVGSKRTSRSLSALQNPTEKNAATRNLVLTGMNRAGNFCKSFKMAKRWHKLIDSGIRCSDKCCDVIKKEPIKRYVKEMGTAAYVGTMAGESTNRKMWYLKQGCNSFDSKEPKSMPLSFWMEEDIWEYLRTYDVPYSKIYDMGEKRTGCMFCMFGVQMEKQPNRFQRMAKSHPAQYKYCMDKLGLAEILDFIGVPYAPVDEDDEMFS